MHIQQQDKIFTERNDLETFLAPCKITWDKWYTQAVTPDLCRRAATEKQAQVGIIGLFYRQLNALKEKFGYQAEDIVALYPEMPNLEAILAKFDKEHHHTDDEVRVTLYGHGIFGIVPTEGEPFEIHVEAGDLIVVPAYTRHWFTLKEDREIVALRVFTTPDGWTAIYDPLDACSVPAPLT